MSSGMQVGRLTTHVLDTTTGCPAANLRIELYRIAGESRELLLSVITNADGRCDGPVLQGEQFVRGTYELVFHVGDYLRPSRRSSTSCRSASVSPTPASITTSRCWSPPTATRPIAAASGCRALTLPGKAER
jgi:5-hydroxyisourate hydrolase